MTSRYAKTPDGRWFAASKHIDGPFKKPLQEWVDQVTAVHDFAPGECIGVEVATRADPRSGTEDDWIHDPVSANAPPRPDKVFDQEVDAATSTEDLLAAIKKWRSSGVR